MIHIKYISLFLIIFSLVQQAHGVSLRDSLSISAFYVSPPGYSRYLCTSTTGQPVLAGSNGTILFVGLSPSLDSIVQIATISTIIGVEHSSRGLLALTEDHQLFRYAGNETQLVYGNWDTRTGFLSRHHWAFQTSNGVVIGTNSSDTPIDVVDLKTTPITFFGSLRSDAYAIGYSDGSLQVRNNSGQIILDTTLLSEPVQFVATDSIGNLIVSTMTGTLQLQPTTNTWQPYLPETVSRRALIGTNHYLVMTREYSRPDTTFSTFAVFDGGGSRVYNGLFVRGTGEPIDSNRVLYMSFDFPNGKELLVSTARELILCSPVAGRYMVSYRDDFTGKVLFADPNSNTFDDINRGFPSFGPNDALYLPVAVKSGSRENAISMNIVASISANGETTYDTLDNSRYGLPKKATIRSILQTLHRRTYFFSNIDTILTIDLKNGGHFLDQGVLCEKIYSNGENHFAVLEHLVSVSTDHGLTWNRRIHSLPGRLRSATFVSDSEFVCLTSDYISKSTLSSTTNAGATWTNIEIPGVWGHIAGISQDKLAILPLQTGIDDVPLRISLGVVDRRSGALEVPIDTTFATTGRVTAGALLGDTVVVLVTGSLGYLKIDMQRYACTFDTSTPFRCPMYQQGGVSFQSGLKAHYASNSGIIISMDHDWLTSVEDNLLRVDVNGVWPVPTRDHIRCRVLLAFEEDRAQATARLYNMNGELQYDLTAELLSGTYSDGFVVFEKYGLDVPVGPYILVVRSGKNISSKNILIIR